MKYIRANMKIDLFEEEPLCAVSGYVAPPCLGDGSGGGGCQSDLGECNNDGCPGPDAWPDSIG